MNLPTWIAVDNDPSSPNTGTSSSPPSEGVVKVYTPPGRTSSTSPASRPTGGRDQSGERQHLRPELFGEASTIFDPSRHAGHHLPHIASGPTDIAVDSTGRVYVSTAAGFSSATGKVEVFDSSGTDLGELDLGPPMASRSIPPTTTSTSTRATGSPSSTPPGTVDAPIGVGEISNSIGVAADSGTVAVDQPRRQQRGLVRPGGRPTDPEGRQPGSSSKASATRRRYTGRLPAEPHRRRRRLPVDPAADRLRKRGTARSTAMTRRPIPSTAPPATRPASARPATRRCRHGLGVTNDGRVFFNSTEGLVDRDLNERKDAYEWKSRRRARADLDRHGRARRRASSAISADGTDAYFFTREKLVAGDDNGSRVKVYDARSVGGFPFVPPAVPCKASDECHGPGSQAPAGAGRSAPTPARRAGTPAGAARRNASTGRACKRHKQQAPSTRASDQGASDMADVRAAAGQTSGGTSRAPSPRRSLARAPLCWRCAPARRAGDRIVHDDVLGPHRRRPPRPLDLLHARRTRCDRGRAQRDLRSSRGDLRQPVRDHPLHLVGLRAGPVPADSQAGLITVYANYEGRPTSPAGDGADLRRRTAGRPDRALRLHRPDAEHPDRHPGRGAHRRRLRPALHRPGNHQSTPLAGADLTFWGFPATTPTTPNASRKASPANRPTARDWRTPRASARRSRRAIPVHPLTDNPTTCAGPLETKLIVQTYRTRPPDHRAGNYPATTECDLEVFNPVLYASPTTTETDPPRG